MLLQTLIDLHKLAPTFIAEYEVKERNAAAQYRLYRHPETTDPEKDLLAYWFTTNSEWLVANQEKYNQCKRMLTVDIAELTQLHKDIEDVNRDD